MASEKKSSEAAIDDLQTFNLENLQSNMNAVNYSRTFMSIVGGVIAGILGFTGLTGFILYFLVMAITSVGLIAKSGFSINSYFNSWNQVVFDGFLGGLMSFVLFWTGVYAAMEQSALGVPVVVFRKETDPALLPLLAGE